MGFTGTAAGTLPTASARRGIVLGGVLMRWEESN